jgi:hypothetical protein
MPLYTINLHMLPRLHAQLPKVLMRSGIKNGIVHRARSILQSRRPGLTPLNC